MSHLDNMRLHANPRLLTTAFAALLCGAVLMITPKPADAGELYGNTFCHVNLGHLNGPNDYCAQHWAYTKIDVASGTHSTCVSSTTNGTKTGVNVGWACSPGPEYEVWNSLNEYAWTEAIIRNNTTGANDEVHGTEWWCEFGPPC